MPSQSCAGAFRHPDLPPLISSSPSHSSVHPHFSCPLCRTASPAFAILLKPHHSLDMSSSTPNFLAPKQEPARRWLTRHLSRPHLRKDQDIGEGEIVKMIRQMPTRPPTPPPALRPSTATSPGCAADDEYLPPIPSIPLDFQRLMTLQEHNSPPRPGRPDPAVLQDVGAWLDASKSSAPLMGGLSYWREGDPADTTLGPKVQYAIPIIQEPDCQEPPASHGQQLVSFCRRAKKQVRMPQLRQMKSSQVLEAGSERSVPGPVVGIPYDETEWGDAPVILTRKVATPSITYPSTAGDSKPTDSPDGPLISPDACSPVRNKSIAPPEVLDQKLHTAHLGGNKDKTSDECPLSEAAAVQLPRGDSMGSLGSSAPTYFSGVPPPSYKSRPPSSRPASILTVSSFGCIDGMNAEYRQLSQQRAAEKQRSVKGRLKKLAKKANLRK